MAAEPEMVDLSKAVDEPSPLYDELMNLPFVHMNVSMWARAVGLWSWKEISQSGNWGDPSHATAERGEALLDRGASVLAEHLKKWAFSPDRAYSGRPAERVP
jgi:creatinine amidohydrolase/Fe(II)-dependent formamide hydrolase-like protein